MENLFHSLQFYNLPITHQFIGVQTLFQYLNTNKCSWL